MNIIQWQRFHAHSVIILVRQVAEILHEDTLTMLLAIVNEHFVLVTFFGLELNDHLTLSLHSLSLGHIVVVAVRAMFIRLLELTDIFTEGLLALLTHKDQFKCLF